MIAAHHPQQAERLRTLRAYGVLDTPRETDFDEIVQLVSRICEAPISVINLIDEDRQWFKAEVGLNARETPLSTSLCAHVILQDDYVEIPDTRLDGRMADNPLCTAEPGLRFYAGARLVAPNGMPIGTLCVLDAHPRQLTPLQAEALRVLSRQVMKQLELRLALRTQQVLLNEADHRVKNSLQTLTSVTRLYRRNLKEPQAQEAFDAVQRRIDAVAALHGELQTNADGIVHARIFLERVVLLLQDMAPETVTITCVSDEVDLSAGAASVLAMIVSEFVANSVKHAFPDSTAGQVDISLRRVAGGLLLQCRDNGVGSTRAAQDASPVENLGSRLVSAAALQLAGHLETQLTPTGAVLTLRF